MGIAPGELSPLAVSHGPVWKHDENGWLMPEVPDVGIHVIHWIQRKVGDGDGGFLKLTDEQKRQVLWAYAVKPGTDEFENLAMITTRIKGAGKSTFAAAWVLAELCAPCRPVLKPDGSLSVVPVSKPWIDCVAVTQEQVGNLWECFASMATEALRAEYGLEVGREQILSPKGKVRAVTSNYAALEGGRPTFVVCDEVGVWETGNFGPKKWAVERRNIDKTKNAHIWTISNPHEPGSESVGEELDKMRENIELGKQPNPGFLFDHLGASDSVDITDREKLEQAVVAARGDATWVIPHRTANTFWDGTIPVATSRRFWLAQTVAAEDALVDPHKWKASKDESLRLEPNDDIVLGFDGARTRDSTALVALRLRDRAFFLLKMEEAPLRSNDPKKKWTVNAEAFNEAVHAAFTLYKVHAFHSDVAYWESYVEDWQREFGDRLYEDIALDMRANQRFLTVSNEALVNAIEEGRVSHDGNKNLTAHVLNTKRRENRYGTSFGKATRDSPEKVDGWAAMLLADIARTRVPEIKKQRVRVHRW